MLLEMALFLSSSLLLLLLVGRINVSDIGVHDYEIHYEDDDNEAMGRRRETEMELIVGTVAEGKRG